MAVAWSKMVIGWDWDKETVLWYTLKTESIWLDDLGVRCNKEWRATAIFLAQAIKHWNLMRQRKLGKEQSAVREINQ